MKRLLLLFLIMAATFFSSIAKDSKNETKPITLESHTIDNSDGSTVHRAPLKIGIEAYFDMGTSSINVFTSGSAIGEVFLYLDGDIIDYRPTINTSFHISAPGLYMIEIIGESWVAIGYLQL